MKIPANAPPDVKQAFQDIHKEIDRLRGIRGQVDLGGRRIGGAGEPIQPDDYVTRSTLDRAIAGVREVVARAVSRPRRPTVIGTPTGGGPTGSTNFDFGYYRVDTLPGQALGAEVRPYTNLAYVGGIDGGGSSTPYNERFNNLKLVYNRLAALGFNFMIDMELGQERLTVSDGLFAAQPHWDKVKYIVLGEVDPNPTQTNFEISEVRRKVAALGLPARPVCVSTDNQQIASTAEWGNYNFDYVGLQAYSPSVPCGTNPTEEVARIVSIMQAMKANVPATKQLFIIMQAYNRNGQCTNQAVMEAVNRAAYFQMAKGDSRVKAIVMFSYQRAGGTKDNPFLIPIHQEIWNDLTGGTSAPPGGPTAGKKCIGDTRNCSGVAVCCEGGDSNPCNCPRLCEGGSYSERVQAATSQVVQERGYLFSTMTPPTCIDIDAAEDFRAFVVVKFNENNPTLKCIADPNDGKQIWIRRLATPEFREDFRVWNTDLTVAFPSGSGYRATCYGEDLTW